jgi:hypothetical protein
MFEEYCLLVYFGIKNIAVQPVFDEVKVLSTDTPQELLIVLMLPRCILARNGFDWNT